jgi:hypothetical protein
MGVIANFFEAPFLKAYLYYTVWNSYQDGNKA